MRLQRSTVGGPQTLGWRYPNWGAGVLQVPAGMKEDRAWTGTQLQRSCVLGAGSREPSSVEVGSDLRRLRQPAGGPQPRGGVRGSPEVKASRGPRPRGGERGFPARGGAPSPSKKRCSASVSSTTSMAARPRAPPAPLQPGPGARHRRRGRATVPARLPLPSRRPLPARPPSRAALARPPPAPRAPPAALCAPCRPARAAAPGAGRAAPRRRARGPSRVGVRGAGCGRPGLVGEWKGVRAGPGSPRLGLCQRPLPVPQSSSSPRAGRGEEWGGGSQDSESGFQNQTPQTPSISSRYPSPAAMTTPAFGDQV